MVKVFISQPMKDLSSEEIIANRARYFDIARDVIKQIETYEPEIHLIDSLFTKSDNPVRMLGNSIKAMSEADYVFFGEGWENSRGCRIEHKVAEEYGLEILQI